MMHHSRRTLALSCGVALLALALPAGAAPPGWIAADIGSPAAKGGTDVGAGDIWTIQGSGADISGTVDQFHFVFQTVKGDVSISARFLGLEGGSSEWAKVGLMVRKNETPGSPNLHYCMTPGHGLHATQRLRPDDETGSFGEVGPSPKPEPELYLRLQRVGNLVSSFYSRDGNVWFQAGMEPQALPGLAEHALVGLTATSHSDGRVTTGKLDQVHLQPGVVSAYGIKSCGGDRLVLLQWQKLPGAMGYNIYRGPAGATRDQLVKLNANPVVESSFSDDSGGLVNGVPSTHAVAAVFQEADGRRLEGPLAAVETTPVAVPPGFLGCSINEGRNPGSVAMDGATGEITLRGSGDATLGATSDQLYLLSQAVEGNVQITVKALTRPNLTSLFAGAGVTIRESPDTGARHMDIAIAPAAGVVVLWRTTTNGITDGFAPIDSGSLKLPIVLRLTRQEDTISAEYSMDDGKTFESTGSALRFDPPLAKAITVGLGITSGTRSQTTEAKFSDLTIKKLP